MLIRDLKVLTGTLRAKKKAVDSRNLGHLDFYLVGFLWLSLCHDHGGTQSSLAMQAGKPRQSVPVEEFGLRLAEASMIWCLRVAELDEQRRALY